MARPRRQLAVDKTEAVDKTKAVDKTEAVRPIRKLRTRENDLGGPSQSSTSGHTVNGNRKRKVAVVEPLPPLASTSRFPTTEKRKDNDVPLAAKRPKESLPKRTSKDNRLRKKKGRPEKRDNKEQTKTRVCLNVPKLLEVAGEALSHGTGDMGQLGLGANVEERKRPALVSLIQEPVVQIAAGGMHSVCLTASGKVFTFGCNDEGTLGRVTEEEEENFVPGLVELPEKVVKVSAGDSHSAVLTETGRVYLWGNFRDDSGPMGLLVSDRKEVHPVQILRDVPCASIASGNEHLVCLGLDGQIYTMGNGQQGQLGRLSHYFSDRGGRKGLNHVLTPKVIHLKRGRDGHIPEFDRVWASDFCTFARERLTGALYGCGLNNFKQLGPDTVHIKFMPEPLRGFEGHRWEVISGGMHHFVAINSEGQVHYWGRRDDNRYGPKEGKEDLSTPVPVQGIKNIRCVDASCGNNATLAVSEDGVVFSWGFGSTCQLGHGNEDDIYEPKAIESQSMRNRKALSVSSGGQHVLILARPTQTATTT